jgi:hypothetical protein
MSNIVSIDKTMEDLSTNPTTSNGHLLLTWRLPNEKSESEERCRYS